MKIDDQTIMRTLIGQVFVTLDSGRRATGNTFLNERDVVTFITRPMWQMFLRGAGANPDQNPTPWLGQKSVRVMGSETIIIESPEFWTFSTLRDSDLYRSYQNTA